MKILLLVLIAATAVTHSSQARDWMWFHGDMGLGSPFVASTPSETKHTTQTAPKVAAKRTPASRRAVVKRKSKSIDHRISARDHAEAERRRHVSFFACHT
jgi:hypothetical protein